MATSSQIAGYLRVAAYAIALFDYLQSLPAEYRLYAKQKGPLKLSVACILFILVRYLGIAAMVMGGVGFFYHGFSKEACDKFYWLAPVFKLFLYLASQAILAIRTYAVSRKSTMVLYILVVLSVVCSLILRRTMEQVEFISTFWKRIRQVRFVTLSQRIAFDVEPAARAGTSQASKWLRSIMSVALVASPRTRAFDVVAMGITVIYLWKFSNTSRASSGMNIMNLIFFQSRDTTIQSSAASLGFAATMIFSSRFILNLSERARDGVSGDSSRTPASGGRRGANHTMAGTGTEGPELVVTVVKNVITMHDMGHDDESARQVKGEQWDAEDGSMP
ncbi:hypothetical protein DFH07DRAFT_975615 [Mycena maculata]|uniref:DUF6533 domain-containing protein n=1 Tax=Mycena maculata TaxID=230809 RepID=A0AAD7KI43_9AGAR|nr:hypothetical protein DFH07DRAFT_975615 [Mycena maculata]